MKHPKPNLVGRVTPCAPACEREWSAGRGLPALPVLALMFVLGIGAHSATFTEDFSINPTANGWQTFGNSELFAWDSTNQNFRVTWDSSQTNSYFHRPLGTVLTRDDDFNLSFDLTFADYASGTTPGKPYAAPVAIGFFNLDQATHTNFFRGAGVNATYGPRNLVEFNFFPAFDIFLPTIDQVIVSTNNSWLYNDDNLLDMTQGETFRVTMNYLADLHTLTTVVSNHAAPYGQTQMIVVPANFDFRVTSLSISSYSDAHDIGSVLAHGTVDNLVVTVPPPPVQDLGGGFSGANWQVQFTSRTNWFYQLERTTNFAFWQMVDSDPTPGNGTTLVLTDSNPPPDGAFYQVKANRP